MYCTCITYPRLANHLKIKGKSSITIITAKNILKVQYNNHQTYQYTSDTNNGYLQHILDFENSLHSHPSHKLLHLAYSLQREKVKSFVSKHSETVIDNCNMVI